MSDNWKNGPGNATSIKWIGGIGGQGNAGVAGQVQQLPGSIGYVELAYALQNKLTYAALKNAAGNYQLPTLAATTAGAAVGCIPAC